MRPKRKSYSVSQTAVPYERKLRSECSSTVLAGPGKSASFGERNHFGQKTLTQKLLVSFGSTSFGSTSFFKNLKTYSYCFSYRLTSFGFWWKDVDPKDVHGALTHPTYLQCPSHFYWTKSFGFDNLCPISMAPKSLSYSVFQVLRLDIPCHKKVIKKGIRKKIPRKALDWDREWLRA